MSIYPPAPPPYEYNPPIEMTQSKGPPCRPAGPPVPPVPIVSQAPPVQLQQPPVYQPVIAAQPAVCQPLIATQPAAPNTSVVVVNAGGGGAGVGGLGIGCPMCKNPQPFVSSFTACGILLALCFFPCGLICCFCMREKKCRNCNFKAG